MAFSVKYRAQWRDQQESKFHQVDVLVEDYAGGISTLRHKSIFDIQYTDTGWVQPSEAVFSFSLDAGSVTAYDADFFESEFRSVKIKYYVGDDISSIALEWVGWLKPDNTMREEYYPELVYQISASDGLLELQQLDYEGYYLQGKETFLQIIKNALGFNQLDDIDFFVMCGIYEDLLMTADEQVFDTMTVDNRRFYRETKGELRPLKCSQVIEEVVKLFYCTFTQCGGYWQIVNGQEFVSVNESTYQSKAWIYDYTTVAEISSENIVPYGRVVIIPTDENRRPAAEKWNRNKLAPLKNLRIVFENKNLGGNELVNGDFSQGVTAWNNGDSAEGWYLFEVTDEILNLVEPPGVGDADSDKLIYSDTFFLQEGEGEGFLDWSIIMELDDIAYTVGDFINNPPYINVTIYGPNGYKRSSGYIGIQNGEFTYLSYPGTIPFPESGDYYIEILYHPNTLATMQSIALKLKEVSVSQSATGGTANTTFDIVYINKPYIRAFEEEEITVLFGDTKQNTDVGGIFRGTDLSSSWSRFFAVSSIPSALASQVLYLPFNANFDDESPYGHDVQNFGATLADDKDSVVNAAYEFDGVADYMFAPFDSISTPNFAFDTISIAMYVKRAADSAHVNEGLIALSNAFAFGISSGGQPRFYFKITGDTTIYQTQCSITTVQDEQWIWLGVTFDGQYVRFYENGDYRLALSYGAIGVLNKTIFSPANGIFIGAGLLGIGSNYGGRLDQIHVYKNRVLSNSQMNELYLTDTITAASTGETEKLPLLYLLAQQYLNDRQAYHDKITVALYDLANGINKNAILSLNSKYYKLLDYSKDFHQMLIKGKILQVDTTDVPFSRTIQNLNSIDGKSTVTPAEIHVIESPPNPGPEETVSNTFNYTWANLESGSVKVGDIATAAAIEMIGALISGTTRCKAVITITHDDTTGEYEVILTPGIDSFENLFTGITISSIGEILLNYDVGSLGASVTYRGIKNIL